MNNFLHYQPIYPYTLLYSSINFNFCISLSMASSFEYISSIVHLILIFYIFSIYSHILTPYRQFYNTATNIAPSAVNVPIIGPILAINTSLKLWIFFYYRFYFMCFFRTICMSYYNSFFFFIIYMRFYIV